MSAIREVDLCLLGFEIQRDRIIVVGSAAVAMSCEAVDVSVHFDDIDLVCDPAYFDYLEKRLGDIVLGTDAVRVLHSRPDEQYRAAGTTNRSIDFIPDACADTRSIALSPQIGDDRFLLNWDDALSNSKEVSGIRVLDPFLVLVWKKTIGREKDKRYIDQHTRLLKEIGVITEEEFDFLYAGSTYEQLKQLTATTRHLLHNLVDAR
jgi:hypothetical protein